MKDVVSRYGTSVVGWVASMSIVSALFVPQGFPWTVLAAASLTLAAAALLAKDLTRSMPTLSMRGVVRAVEAEPSLAVAVAERMSPVGRSRLCLK